MELYPAIDLRGGRCVRLHQGDFDRETVYDDDPVARAGAFAAAGSPWVHVVDLDGARTGEPANRSVVAAIAAALAGSGTRVQAGGGVRSAAAAEALLDAGIDRVVLGTAAVDDPALVSRLAAAHPGAVAVGVDVRGDEVAVRGWASGTGQAAADVVGRFADAGVAALVVTQILVDATMAGPDLDGLAALLSATDVDLVASGGVGSIAHLAALAELEVEGRRLAGAIVGKALYEGAFGLDDALDAVRGRRSS